MSTWIDPRGRHLFLKFYSSLDSLFLVREKVSNLEFVQCRKNGFDRRSSISWKRVVEFSKLFNFFNPTRPVVGSKLMLRLSASHVAWPLPFLNGRVVIFINDRAMSIADLTGKFVSLQCFFARYIFPFAKFQSSKAPFCDHSGEEGKDGRG